MGAVMKIYMHILGGLLVCALTLIGGVTTAQAGPKFGSSWWWWNHWVNQDYMPYYETSINPHNSQWDSGLGEVQGNNPAWQPADWISMNGGTGVDLINRWYVADIIERQYLDDHIPYLDVGVNFYHLSGYDQRRVMQTVDYVYHMTSRHPRMFYLKDADTNKIIGYYGPEGLTMQ